jgi:hypothetical protein
VNISGSLLQAIFAFFILCTPWLLNAQDEPSEQTYHFNGNISVTNNGFSLVPTFSLGKPATVAELSLGGNRFSFDPQFRFDLAGLKPWSFIFIWRYKAIQTDRFQLRLGAHLPAIAFVDLTYVVNGISKTQLTPSRYFTPEITPTYFISKRVNVGMYYLWGIGLEKEDQTRHTHFISVRAGFNRIPLAAETYFSWNPQIYYLTMDGTGGFYAAHVFEIGYKSFPLTISSMMNVKLKSDIATKDFDWNISMVYKFSLEFEKK